MAKTLHEVILANLDPVTNGKGRPIQEYRLRVEKLEDGAVLAVVLAPYGFESEETVFGIDGATLTDESTIADARAQIAAARLAEQQAADEKDMEQRVALGMASAEEVALVLSKNPAAHVAPNLKDPPQ